LEGTLQTILFHPPALGRAPFHQPRLLQAPSNLALNPAREGAATASLGSLGQGLTTLLGKNFCPGRGFYSGFSNVFKAKMSLKIVGVLP